jgi:hypothetical protein
MLVLCGLSVLKSVIHKKGSLMKKDILLAVSVVTIFGLTTGAAQAAGCIKGAMVGAVAGHVAGHHAVLGAITGCAVGHHMAKVAKAKPVAARPAE